MTEVTKKRVIGLVSRWLLPESFRSLRTCRIWGVFK